MSCSFAPTVEQWVHLLPALADLIRSLAWPAVALFLAWLFRDQIAIALTRIKKVSATGLELDPPTEQSSKGDEEKNPALHTASAGAALPDVVDDVWAHDAHLRPWRVLVETAPNLVGLSSETLRSRLVSALAWQNRRTMLFAILREIFGSQIELLLRLNGMKSIYKQTALEIFQDLHIARAAGTTPLQFSAWLTFLINKDLIVFRGRAAGEIDDLLSITEFGEDMAAFLNEFGETAQTRPY